MPEAVIVATARTPIGRAFKGSLKDVRPDDLAATIVRAALDKVPALDPAHIDDLYLGCAEPCGEHGSNMARVVAVLPGYDHLPGRDRQPVLRLVRADHPDGLPRDQGRRGRRLRLRRRRVRLAYNGFAGAGGSRGRLARTRGSPRPQARTRGDRGGQRDLDTTRASDGLLPDVYIAMGQTAENVATCAASAASARTSGASRARTAPRRPSPTASSRARSRR